MGFVAPTILAQIGNIVLTNREIGDSVDPEVDAQNPEALESRKGSK